ncbi:hypothetical protein LJC42_07635, partial [Eubacteriales bacterium OttesenSCG-928-K08]|nr:hypothetical protein [Eubacteriales bacterium OttesenSCG-928-K08]
GNFPLRCPKRDRKQMQPMPIRKSGPSAICQRPTLENTHHRFFATIIKTFKAINKIKTQSM